MNWRSGTAFLLNWLCYGFIGFVLYRFRVTSQSPVWDSDALVFWSPALLAFAISTMIVYAALPGTYSTARRTLTGVLTSALAMCLFAWAYTCVAFTLYGT